MLLKTAAQKFRKLRTPLLVGAVIFGLISGTAQSILGQQATDNIAESLRNLGADKTRMEQIAKRAEKGDPKAMDDLLQEFIDIGNRLDAMNEADRIALAEETAADAFLKFLPMFSVLSLTLAFIYFLATRYYLVVATRNISGVGHGFRATLHILLPLIGAAFWVGFASFGWIPIIGLLFFVILIPRLMFTSILVIHHQGGVIDSSKQSFAATKGHWFRIVGTLILLALFVCISTACTFAITSFISLISGPLGMFALSCVFQIILAFATVYVVVFAESILPQHAS